MKRENVFLNLDLSDLSAQPGALHIGNKFNSSKILHVIV